METIEIKLGQLDFIISSLSNLVTKELPIKLSYRLSKLIKVLANEHELYNQNKNEIIKKYAEKDEEGNIKQLEDNKINILSPNEYQRNLEELHLLGFEVLFEKIKIDELGDINISVQDLLNLDKFITD